MRRSARYRPSECIFRTLDGCSMSVCVCVCEMTVLPNKWMYSVCVVQHKTYINSPVARWLTHSKFASSFRFAFFSAHFPILQLQSADFSACFVQFELRVFGFRPLVVCMRIVERRATETQQRWQRRMHFAIQRVVVGNTIINLAFIKLVLLFIFIWRCLR